MDRNLLLRLDLTPGREEFLQFLLPAHSPGKAAQIIIWATFIELLGAVMEGM
jgi:hypothetical protein